MSNKFLAFIWAVAMGSLLTIAGEHIYNWKTGKDKHEKTCETCQVCPKAPEPVKCPEEEKLSKDNIRMSDADDYMAEAIEECIVDSKGKDPDYFMTCWYDYSPDVVRLYIKNQPKLEALRKSGYNPFKDLEFAEGEGDQALSDDQYSSAVFSSWHSCLLLYSEDKCREFRRARVTEVNKLRASFKPGMHGFVIEECMKDQGSLNDCFANMGDNCVSVCQNKYFKQEYVCLDECGKWLESKLKEGK